MTRYQLMTSVMFVLNEDDDKNGAKMTIRVERAKPIFCGKARKINEKRSGKADQKIMRVPFSYDWVYMHWEYTHRRHWFCDGKHNATTMQQLWWLCEGLKIRKKWRFFHGCKGGCTSAGPKLRDASQRDDDQVARRLPGESFSCIAAKYSDVWNDSAEKLMMQDVSRCKSCRQDEHSFRRNTWNASFGARREITLK